MTYIEAQQLLASTGWTSDYWWNNREFFNHPEAPRQWVFLHQDDIGIDDPYSTEISLIYCNMTADELREYTRLCKAMWQCEANPEQTTIAKYREVRKEHKGFVQAMRRKKSGSILAKVNREPGGLVEQFGEQFRKMKEHGPAGMKPVKYIGIGNSIFKEVDGQREECIEIVYPDDDNIDEKSLLLSSVLAHADEILNFAGGDEQMHATEERLLKDWMNAYGAGYRDCRTKAVIERSLSGKAKVTFKATFLY